MRASQVAVDKLLQDPANVRQHSTRNIETIKASLARFGQQKPIVVDGDGVVVAGNGTLHAARELGWQKVHVVRSTLTGSDRTAYAIADNRTAELAEWDDAALAEQLSALAIDDDELLAAAGFDEAELERLVNETTGLGADDVVEDEAPEPPADPVTKPGDLWQLGDHRVLCGDCVNASRIFGSGAADMILTDPPYGVSYVGKTKDALTVENDNLSEGNLKTAIGQWFDSCWEMSRDGAYWYATVPAGPLHLHFAFDWKRRGVLRQIMVWNKDCMVLGHSEYHYKHEPILFGWKPGGKRHKNKDRTRTTVWDEARPKRSAEHPTMKPVALWARAMSDGSRVGELVFDPFLGSGTTLIAAEQLGRRCYGTEISPAYCDVIVERWENLTGKKAKRVADG